MNTGHLAFAITIVCIPTTENLLRELSKGDDLTGFYIKTTCQLKIPDIVPQNHIACVSCFAAAIVRREVLWLASGRGGCCETDRASLILETDWE